MLSAEIQSESERKAAKVRRWVENNRERSREIKAAWKKRNPEAVRQQARDRTLKSPEKVAAVKRKYQANNRDKVNASLRRRRAAKPGAMIALAVGNGIRAAIRKSKAGRRWESIVGYDLPTLRAHIETLFAEGMSWENFGYWHIDHKRPVSSFDFSVDTDAATKECWAISNLQPLWAKDNMRKGSRWIK